MNRALIVLLIGWETISWLTGIVALSFYFCKRNQTIHTDSVTIAGITPIYPIVKTAKKGDVVMTQNGWDIGLVTDIDLFGKPKCIVAHWNKYNDSNDHKGCGQYGAIDLTDWYHTGIHMTLTEWIQISKDTGDALGFYRYFRRRIGLGLPEVQ